MSKRKHRQSKGAITVGSKMGRPTKYRREFAQQAQKICKLGGIDRDLAEFFGVSIRTINYWKLLHEDFARAMSAGKDNFDDRIEHAMAMRAMGYDRDAVKIGFKKDGTPVIVPYIEHIPPDVNAGFKWLAKRRPQVWGDNPTKPDDPLSKFFEHLMGAVTYPGRQPGEQILGNAEFVKKIEDLTKDDDDPSDDDSPDAGPAK